MKPVILPLEVYDNLLEGLDTFDAEMFLRSNDINPVDNAQGLFCILECNKGSPNTTLTMAVDGGFVSYVEVLLDRYHNEMILFKDILNKDNARMARYFLPLFTRCSRRREIKW